MNVKLDVNQIFSMVQNLLAMVVKFALLVLLAVLTAKHFHTSGSFVTAPNVTEMAYLAGGWYLWAKA